MKMISSWEGIAHGHLDLLLITHLPASSVNITISVPSTFALEAVPGAEQGPACQPEEVSAQRKAMKRVGPYLSSRNASQIHVGDYFQSWRQVQKAIILLMRVTDCLSCSVCWWKLWLSCWIGWGMGRGERTGCQNMIFSGNKNKQKFRSTTSTS